MASLRRISHTGLPRHDTVCTLPASIADVSTLTGPPRALAASEGSRLATNGAAAASSPMPPITLEAATSALRRLASGRVPSSIS